MLRSTVDPAALAQVAHEGRGLALSLLATVFLAGFRHGFDIDHVAAITDIASASPSRKVSLWLATAYALGHMLMVLGLGVVAVFAGDTIPGSFDLIAQRLIGLSLLLLGLYVLYSVIRHRRDFRMRSRWMSLIAGARRGLQWMRPVRQVVIEHEHEHPIQGHHDHAHDHEGSTLLGTPPPPIATRTETHIHTHEHLVTMPSDPFTEYSMKTSFLIGMIHGVGAETPTQILLFTTAAGLAGALGGVTLVGMFVAGLLLGNTVLAIVSTAGVSAGTKVARLHMGVATTAAVISIYVGWSYLFATTTSSRYLSRSDPLIITGVVRSGGRVILHAR